MDEKYKSILENNKEFLLNNIIPTEEFYDKILHDKILPETMLRDVKEGRTREEQNHRLLNALQLRTSLAFKKFRNVLFDTGHSFLSDLLWEEESNTSLVCEDVFIKFPEMFSKLSNESKKRFHQFVERKIREKCIRSVWGKSCFQRMETLRVRSSEFRLERQLRLSIDELQKKVQVLELTLKKKEDETRYLSIEARALEKQLEQTRMEHKNNIEKQTSFNIANNSTIVRLRGRIATFNSDIIRMNEMMREVLGEEASNYQSDADNVRISLLEYNLNELLKKASNEKTMVNGISDEEKNELVNMLFPGGYSGVKDSIKDIVKAYVEKERKHTQNLVKEIEKILDSLKGKPQYDKSPRQNKNHCRYISNMLAMVRVEVEHLNKRLVWKNSEITNLTNVVEEMKKDSAVSWELQDQQYATTLHEVSGMHRSSAAKNYSSPDVSNARRSTSSDNFTNSSSLTRRPSHRNTPQNEKRKKTRKSYNFSNQNGVEDSRSNRIFDKS